ncbi:MAG: BatA domain-containing protein [Bacteroidia bacterium]|nr:BatA domain-containing protein [Bacteroidia bacterium]
MVFVYPSFLWALLLVSIPIIIHLFHFRKYKRVVFSDVRFLKQLQEQNKSKQKIKDWLLLAARVLAVASLVLAFAQPFIPHSDIANISGVKSISVFVDNSMSMQAQGNDGPYLEIAKSKARAIIGAYTSNDRFQILTNNLSATEQRALTQSEAIEKIDAIEPSVASVSLNTIQDKQESFLQKSESYKSVYYISDFQKSQFTTLVTTNTDSSIHTTFIPIHSSTIQNLSVDSIYFVSPNIKINTPIVAKVKVTNHGNESVEGVVMKVLLNGVQKGLLNIKLGANESDEFSLNITCNQSGWQNGIVTLNDFPIAFDNQLYFAFKPTDKNRVLVIGNTPNKYIQSIFAEDADYELVQNTVTNINYQELAKYQLVVLNEVDAISSGLSLKLDEYLENGGQIVLIPGNSLSEGLHDFCSRNALPLYAAKVSQELQVTHINKQSVLFEKVFTKSNNQMDLPKLKAYYPLQINANTRGNSLIELNNGASLLWQSIVKNGKVYMLALPLDPMYSNLPNHSLIVPMFLNFAIGNQKHKQLYAVLKQTPFVVLPEKVSGDEKLIQIKGDKQEYVTEVSKWQQQQVISTNMLNLDGWYDVFLTQNNNPIFTFAINYNRNESKLDFWNNSEIQSAISNNKNADVNTKDAKVLGAQLTMQLKGEQLWRWFVLAALCFVCIEILIIRFIK